VLNDRPQPRLVVLGAGTPFDGLRHSGLRAVDRDSRVLDWILHAFGSVRPEVTFVGGYQLEEVMARFPDFSYVRNPDWRATGSLGSLRLVPFREGVDHYFCYSDIVFQPALVARLAGARAEVVSAVVDRSYPSRYRDLSEGRAGKRELARVEGELVAAAGHDVPQAGAAEFVGLVRVPGALAGRVAAVVAGLPAALQRQHLGALVAPLAAAGVAVTAVEVSGEWSDLNSPRCLARFVLGGKAEALERLGDVLKRARVLPQLRFSVARWRADKANLAAEAARLHASALAVRSSALNEDGFETANAGVYRSVLHVRRDAGAIAQAVEEVISSFADGRDAHQVFIQPMVQDAVCSGVALTRKHGNGAPYYAINYAMGGDTSAVTGGSRGGSESVFILRETRRVPVAAPRELQAVLDALEEIESLVHYDALDVEFAVDRAGLVTLLQVRPLVVDSEHSREDDARVVSAVQEAAARFDVLAQRAPQIAGTKPLWGCMPDWNPAEIIGVRPRALASSLYFHLITDEVWAQQRAEYGYRDVRPLPLIRLFAGQPYVDVRASLNSFVPAMLPPAQAARLVEGCVAYLQAHPELHDKIEFEVIPTALDLDFARWEARLCGEGQLDREGFKMLAEGLRSITVRGLQRAQADLIRIEQVAALAAGLRERGGDLLERGIAMVEECRRHGTLPFAHLARSAFVAMTILNSAVRKGVLAPERRDRFLESMETVSKQFRMDALRVRTGALDFEAFVAKYGHLRPGTYEITSERYAGAPERYLKPAVEAAREEHSEPFSWTAGERRALDAALGEAGLGIDTEGFERFARSAIAGRELSKFTFTRMLSDALESFAAYGEALGLTRDDVSHLPYPDLRAAAAGALPGASAARRLAARVEASREWQRIVDFVELPPLLGERADCFAFLHPASAPNFVTSKRVVAKAVSGPALRTKVEGCIALIPQADPGYDWLFSQRIAGLVTMYGGANSHMAIRAAELGLPAAIGVGEPRYAELCRAALLQLDCAAKQVVGVS